MQILSSVRVHNDIVFYGYRHDDTATLYWSMRFYPEAWHPPMNTPEVLRAVAYATHRNANI